MRLRARTYARCLLLLWLVAVGCGADGSFTWITPEPVPPTLTFRGEIARGETFVYPVTDELEFRLIPYGQDWEIAVGAPGDTANFAAVLTPPLYGINARHVEGWHFRNRANTGPNAPGDLNVNAPQMTRPFCFALAADAATQAADWLAARQAGQPPPAEFAFPTATGVLTITDLALGNLVVGEKAWIERMAFDVTLNLSTPCPPF